MFVAVPFIIWLMVPHFENLPQELFEAAMIDGCSENKIFFKILLPLVRPGIITAALMSFIYSWNNFLFALVLSGYETKTLPMAVYNFIGYAKISWGPLMAAATMITGPIVLISLIMQKYVVSGMTAGAVKG
jgi:multiple sugar transport system permease protein